MRIGDALTIGLLLATAPAAAATPIDPARALPSPLALGPEAAVFADPGGDRWILLSETWRPFAAWLDAGRLVTAPIALDGAVSEVAFSPDGARLVFVVRPPGWTPDAPARAATLDALARASRTRLVVADWPREVPGTARLFVHPAPAAPSARTDWNPLFLDGSRLLFASQRTGLASYFVVDLGTGETTQLTNLNPLRRAAMPVANTGAQRLTSSGTVLFTTRVAPGLDEVWLLELPDSRHGARARRIAAGRLGTRLGADWYGIVGTGPDRWVDGLGTVREAAP